MKKSIKKLVIPGLITAIAMIVVAVIGYFAAVKPTLITIEATQTAEAKLFRSTQDEFYDDFNNDKYDGYFNTELWLPQLDPNCIVYQENGVMVFQNEISSSF